MTRLLAAAASLALAACQFSAGQAAADAPADTPGDVVHDASSRLANRGLVVRYLMDEAATGMAPTALLDAAPSPLNVPITYSPKLAYAGSAGHHGLEWTGAGDPGVADVALVGSKIAVQLTGKTAWTMEVVVNVKALSPPPNLVPRILTIGTGSASLGTATLIAQDLGHVTLAINGGQQTTWAVDESMGPYVLQAVVDSNAPASDRVRFYANGAALALGGGAGVSSGAGLAIQPTDHLAIGNADGGGQSFMGNVMYAALYTVALSPAEVAQNASALQANDDSQ